MIDALHYGGLALLVIALLGIGAGLVSGLMALRVVVAICLVALAAAVVSFLHEQYADRSVDGILGGLMVVYCVIGLLVRRGRTPGDDARGVAPFARRARRLNGRPGYRGNAPGHRGVGLLGKTVPPQTEQEVGVDELRRLAMISLHTSPLDQPGTGDAGGMNVYVIELAKRLARRGVEVDIFTRATSSSLDQVVEACDGVTVRHIHAGPFEGLTKNELPAQLCVFAREVLRTEASQPVGHYDLVHSHYWLSGQVGALARDRWGVPLVHSMHTMAKVKNDALAEGDTPEPLARVIGEEQVVEAADMLIASTDLEAKQLIELYDADPGGSRWSTPVSTSTSSGPSRSRRPARRSGCPRTPTSCSSPAGSSRSRRPTCCSARWPRCSSASRAVAPGSWSRSSVARPGPGSTSRRRSPTSRRSSDSPTWSGSSPRSRRPSSPSGTPRRRWSPCRRTTSPSDWSPSRPRRPAPPSSLPRSAA